MKWFIDTEFYERGNGGSGRIDLISIGMVSSTGLEFYAENDAFNWNAVTDPWLHENVRPHLVGRTAHANPWGIGRDIAKLVGPQPEFWGWYCDYDWVVFCWLFGRMVDLPPSFPKFCRDLKQLTKERHIDAATLPVQTGAAHNALEDARWNKSVYEHIQALRDKPTPTT